MEDDFKTVSFRVRKGEIPDFQLIADVLYQAKMLKRPSIGLLAKTYLYAQVLSLYIALINRTTRPSSINSQK